MSEDELAERAGAALDFLAEGCQVEGSHHKAWIIDQVVRILAGDDYDSWIAEYRHGEDGPYTYFWDEGIPP